MTEAVYVVGDIHGQIDKLSHLLQSTGIVGDNLEWQAGTATLCFLGDFCDRGPDGIGCINLAMSLEQQAQAAGGRVISLLGNHEVMILAAHFFGNIPDSEWGDKLLDVWLRNGGVARDFDSLEEKHIEWITHLPGMVRIGDTLLIHSDAMFYMSYGDTIEEVNESFYEVFQQDSPAIWIRLLNEFTERAAFADVRESGSEHAALFLETFEAKRIIHGHTPISTITREAASKVTQPYVYAEGQCINVDGGMYLGGPGFICQLIFKSSSATDLESNPANA